MQTPDMLQSRVIDQPQPGFFLLRLVRKGPWVPAAICHDSDGWHAVINGERGDSHADPAHAPGVFRIWHGGRVCTEAEYHHRLHVRAWAEQHMPQHPAAQPRAAIDLQSLPPLF